MLRTNPPRKPRTVQDIGHKFIYPTVPEEVEQDEQDEQYEQYEQLEQYETFQNITGTALISDTNDITHAQRLILYAYRDKKNFRSATRAYRLLTPQLQANAEVKGTYFQTQLYEMYEQNRQNSLKNCKDFYKSNKMVVEAACSKEYGEGTDAFQYADESLKNDPGFIIHLIKTPGLEIGVHILKHVNKTLTRNADFMHQMVQTFGQEALQYANQ